MLQKASCKPSINKFINHFTPPKNAATSGSLFTTRLCCLRLALLKSLSSADIFSRYFLMRSAPGTGPGAIASSPAPHDHNGRHCPLAWTLVNPEMWTNPSLWNSNKALAALLRTQKQILAKSTSERFDFFLRAASMAGSTRGFKPLDMCWCPSVLLSAPACV